MHLTSLLLPLEVWVETARSMRLQQAMTITQELPLPAQRPWQEHRLKPSPGAWCVFLAEPTIFPAPFILPTQAAQAPGLPTRTMGTALRCSSGMAEAVSLTRPWLIFTTVGDFHLVGTTSKSG